MSSTHVCLRLSDTAWTRYSEEAQARGMALATYLRRHLEEQDRILAELAALRAALEQRAPPVEPTDRPTTAIEAGALVELLLLLRSLAGPQKAAVVQKEVERRGLEIWR